MGGGGEVHPLPPCATMEYELAYVRDPGETPICKGWGYAKVCKFRILVSFRALWAKRHYI